MSKKSKTKPHSSPKADLAQVLSVTADISGNLLKAFYFLLRIWRELHLL